MSGPDSEPERGPAAVDELRAAEALAGAAGGDVAQFHESLSPIDRAQRWLHGHPTASPAIVLALSFLYFSVFTDRFFTTFNMSTILAQVMIIGTLGVAQTLVILTAGIDLSVGSITLLSSVVMARLAVVNGYDQWIALAIGMGVGALCGLINGVLVTRFKLPPFIATLGTFNVFQALAVYFSKNETVRNSDIDDQAPAMLWFGNVWRVFSDFRIVYGSIVMIALFVFFWYVLRRTAFGQHIYATGDEPETARLVGIPTDRVLIAVYTLAGLICGIAGWLWISRIGASSPKPLENANLDSITAVVIGGTSLFGGRGSIFGTLLGALIVGTFDSGLSQLGVDPLWRVFAVGVLVLVAVALDQWIRRVAE
jgi:fructose transport system permease protein